MRARHRLPIGLALAACLSTGGLAIALLLLIDALDTGQAVLAGRSAARIEAPGLFWAYVGALAVAGLAAAAVLAGSLAALAADPTARRRPFRPRRPRPPRTP
jgi:hypothetical protein